MSSVEERLETAPQVNHMTSPMTHQCHSAQWIEVIRIPRCPCVSLQMGYDFVMAKRQKVPLLNSLPCN